MFKKHIFYILIMSIFLSSCSMFNWTRTPLKVMASEPDAKIYINEEYIGDGVVEIRVPRHEDVSVFVKKDGFKTVHQNVTYRLGMIGTVDLIFGFVILVPFIGLFFPGAYTLEQENLGILLEKE